MKTYSDLELWLRLHKKLLDLGFTKNEAEALLNQRPKAALKAHELQEKYIINMQLLEDKVIRAYCMSQPAFETFLDTVIAEIAVQLKKTKSLKAG